VKRILVALDASPVSIHAARVAGRLFRDVPDVEFLAINVAPVPTSWAGDALGGAYALPPAVWQDLEDEALDTGGVEERAHEAGIAHVEAVAELGDPVNRIVTAAEEHDVSLVVVGAHDKGFLRRLVDPSVSHGVLRHTQRPVLVVHEEHAAGGSAAGSDPGGSAVAGPTGPEAADTGGGASA